MFVTADLKLQNTGCTKITSIFRKVRTKNLYSKDTREKVFV